MKALLNVFFWGMFISFVGTLPLGTLNVAAMQISIQESITEAIYFAIGCLIVEMIYVRISLVGIDWVRKRTRLMKAMEWVTLIIILALAAGSFYAALSPDSSSKNLILQNNMHRFFLGLLMSAINPVQIPFWFGWSALLFSRNILSPSAGQYNIYIIGIGIGTLAGNVVFIFGGKYLAENIDDSSKYINWVIGGVFSFTALIQLWKMIRRKDPIEKFKQSEEAEDDQLIS